MKPASDFPTRSLRSLLSLISTVALFGAVLVQADGAESLILCAVKSCPSDDFRRPEGLVLTVPVPEVMPPRIFLAADRYIVPAGSTDVSLAIDGDVTILASDGVLQARGMDLRARGDLLRIEPGLRLDAEGILALCSGDSCQRADDVRRGLVITPRLAGAFVVRVLGPIDGQLSVYSGGELRVAADPIPEPGSAILIGVGLTALASRPRRSSVPRRGGGLPDLPAFRHEPSHRRCSRCREMGSG